MTFPNKKKKIRSKLKKKIKPNFGSIDTVEYNTEKHSSLAIKLEKCEKYDHNIT